MKQALIAFGLLAGIALNSELCFSQDPLAGHMVTGLKKLRTVTVVLRPNVEREIVSLTELQDMVEFGLHRKIPELTVRAAKKSSAWLELNFITVQEASLVELSVYRWVRIADTGEEMFSKVWWDMRLVRGNLSRSTLQDLLDTLLTKLAADYLREGH